MQKKELRMDRTKVDQIIHEGSGEIFPKAPDRGGKLENEYDCTGRSGLS